MFKKLFFLSLSIFFITVHAQDGNTVISKKYGMCVRNLSLDAPAFPQFEKVAEAAKISLEWIGFEMATGEPVWSVKNLAEAERIKKLLKKEGYEIEIIQVRFDDEPNATVIGLEAISNIAEQLNEKLAEAGLL